MSTPALRPYQIACLSSIETALDAGLWRLLIQSATGTGKTQVFASIPKRLTKWLSQFPAKDQRVLVIAHREELIDQAVKRFQQLNPGLMVSAEQGDRVASPYADVIVASIQTLTAMKCRRLLRLTRHGTFRVVIYDECHHASSPTARTALVKLGFLPPIAASETESLDEAPSYDDVNVMEHALGLWDEHATKDRLLVGFTATPNRSDGIGLGAVFQDICFSYPIRKAVADGWLVPPVPYIIETDCSLDDVRTTAGEFNQKDLAKAVNQANRNNLAVKGWQQYAENQPTLGFTVDVAHAHAMADLFQAVGARFYALSGETPKDDRRIMLRQYSEGQIDGIMNCMVLTEGTDLPRTGCILHCKPTKSSTLYEQMTGRGLRLFDGKTKCIVIDVVDVSRRHSLQVAPSLYGLPPGLNGKGETLEQLADEWDELKGKYPQLDDLLTQRLTIEQLRIKASTFDIWSVPDLGAFGQAVSLNWMKIGEDVYHLQYPFEEGKETIQVSRDLLGKWEIVCTIQPPDHAPKRQRTIAHGILDQVTAASMAESFIQQERRQVLKLKDKSAPWRDGLASPKQLATLGKFRVPHDPKTLTKGRASDLLDLAFARMKQRGSAR